MSRRFVVFLAVTALLAAGAGFAIHRQRAVEHEPLPPPPPPREVLTTEAREILDGADQLELLGLVCERPPAAGEPTFHRYAVTKRITLDSAARAKALDALYAGLDPRGPVAGCFEPHHGIHATRGHSTVDLVICFTCLQIEVFVDGKQQELVITTGAARPTFDGILASGG